MQMTTSVSEPTRTLWGRISDPAIDIALYGGKNLAIGYSIGAGNSASVYFFTPNPSASFSKVEESAAGRLLSRAAAILRERHPGLSVKRKLSGICTFVSGAGRRA
ncbi:MAG: hypothetical protein J0M12_06360 [Deltaproteobacteria bacterium]|nr:hypothetical protein [Deltaproteobacteria bacterium]